MTYLRLVRWSFMLTAKQTVPCGLLVGFHAHFPRMRYLRLARWSFTLTASKTPPPDPGALRALAIIGRNKTSGQREPQPVKPGGIPNPYYGKMSVSADPI